MRSYKSLLCSNVVRMPEVIKYKKLDPNVPDLKRHSDGAAGYDLYNIHEINYHCYPNVYHKIPTGVAVEIPFGYYGLIICRSSCIRNELGDFRVEQSIIDSDYRGEIHLPLVIGLKISEKIPRYSRLAQLIIAPCFMEQMELLIMLIVIYLMVSIC